MGLITLLNARHPLAETTAQRATLAAVPLARTFETATASAGHDPLRTTSVSVLQLNVGKRCNQACHHCHVDAGPDRTEVMPPDVVDACLRFLETSDIPTLDITGGAPELHPRFRDIVERARAAGRHVMDRCNLTITRLPNYADLPEFLAEHRVEVVASLPSFAGRQTDAQRGDGVFADSIAALQRFNELGYGIEGSGLLLQLVTNPVGLKVVVPHVSGPTLQTAGVIESMTELNSINRSCNVLASIRLQTGGLVVICYEWGVFWRRRISDDDLSPGAGVTTVMVTNLLGTAVTSVALVK
jgi:hypothetical protein